MSNDVFVCGHYGQKEAYLSYNFDSVIKRHSRLWIGGWDIAKVGGGMNINDRQNKIVRFGIK